MQKIIYFWFRRDIRLTDNHGLFRAVELAKAQGAQIQCAFIFDQSILDRLENKRDARVQFIHQEIASIKEQLQQAGGDLQVWYGHPVEVWAQQLQKNPGIALVCNHDYEPSAMERDNQVESICAENQMAFQSYKDHCILRNRRSPKTMGNRIPFSRHTAENGNCILPNTPLCSILPKKRFITSPKLHWNNVCPYPLWHRWDLKLLNLTIQRKPSPKRSSKNTIKKGTSFGSGYQQTRFTFSIWHHQHSRKIDKSLIAQ